VRGRIGSPYFESDLTCPRTGTIAARVPYKGEVQASPERFVLQLTSNGFESTRDPANRSCLIRIRKRHGFSFRRYSEGGLLEHIAFNQLRYLGAVYCVIAQWLAHGKQATEDTRGEGRFRRWAQIMDWIVQELLASNPRPCERVCGIGHDHPVCHVAIPLALVGPVSSMPNNVRLHKRAMIG
jgi:hypothetical protein